MFKNKKWKFSIKEFLKKYGNYITLLGVILFIFEEIISVMINKGMDYLIELFERPECRDFKIDKCKKWDIYLKDNKTVLRIITDEEMKCISFNDFKPLELQNEVCLLKKGSKPELVNFSPNFFSCGKDTYYKVKNSNKIFYFKINCEGGFLKVCKDKE